jgi:hypothetical protein
MQIWNFSASHSKTTVSKTSPAVKMLANIMQNYALGHLRAAPFYSIRVFAMD